MGSELEQVGWDDHWQRWWKRWSKPHRKLEGLRVARVRRVDRGEVDLIGDDGPFRARSSPADAELPRPAFAPATGDWVAAADDTFVGEDDQITVEPALVAIAPRRTELRRRDPSVTHGSQVLATNMDTVLVTEPLDREVNERRIERALTIALDSGAEVALIMTKADRSVDDNPLELARAAAPGVPVILSSVESGLGLDEVRELFRPGQTVALFGPSGAGKSTLTNVLFGEDVAEVGDVRERDRRGLHTTVTRDLITLPGGGILIDTPGVRELGLWDAERGLALAFVDITDAATGCRFSDCYHDNEPGCGVSAAVGAGHLPTRRLDSWRDLHGELTALVEERERHERTQERRDAYRSKRRARRR